MNRVYQPSAWQALISRWSSFADVHLPLRTDNGVWLWQTAALDSLDWLRPDYRPTDYPIKRWLLPPKEKLFGYQVDTGVLEPTLQLSLRPQVFVGVLPCDLAAIALLDQVYLADPIDPWYQARRESLYLIGLTCNSPRDAACCCDLLPEPAVSAGDLLVSFDSERLSVEVGSPKGLELLDLTASGQLSNRWGGPGGNASEQLSAGSVPRSYWEQQAETCLGCGACSLVCPTCLCYDLDDNSSADGERGERWRHTDSCQLAHFALVAGGHSFLPTSASRLEHRWRQKLEYLPRRHGRVFCVGCGRCERHCLAGHSMRASLSQRVKSDE